MAKIADPMDKIAEGVAEGFGKITDGAMLNEDGSLKTAKNAGKINR